MKKAASAYDSSSNWRDYSDDYEDTEGSREDMKSVYSGGCIGFGETDAMSDTCHCILDVVQQGEDRTGECSRRQDRKIGAHKLEEHFQRASYVLEDLIEEELDRYRADYARPVDPAQHNDAAKLLMPDCAPPLQLASVGWLGDWRPTAMLALLTGLARSSGSFSDPNGIGRTVSGLAREARIEEAVIDEELAEIQATCVLNMPFAFSGKDLGLKGAAGSRCVGDELQKIRQVVAKAQQLRFKTLETVVRKVPNPSDAAEFLMVFERIQRALHQVAAQHELRNCNVTFSVKRLGILDST